MAKVIQNQQEPAYITNPVNLDRALQELQRALKDNLAWLSRAYSRARCVPERVGEKTYILPKVYYGGKEYLNILLNDTVQAQSWFQMLRGETPLDYGPMNVIQKFSASVAAIFWIDLRKVHFDANEDYLHLELCKQEIHTILNKYPNVTITNVYDEHARDIFREYTTEVEKEQFLTYPRAGLRFEFEITYDYDFECETESI